MSEQSCLSHTCRAGGAAAGSTRGWLRRNSLSVATRGEPADRRQANAGGRERTKRKKGRWMCALPTVVRAMRRLSSGRPLASASFSGRVRSERQRNADSHATQRDFARGQESEAKETWRKLFSTSRLLSCSCIRACHPQGIVSGIRDDLGCRSRAHACRSLGLAAGDVDKYLGAMRARVRIATEHLRSGNLRLGA